VDPFLIGFPGLDCPGLIEANIQERGRPPERRFPGLDCPGLIEALFFFIDPSFLF